MVGVAAEPAVHFLYVLFLLVQHPVGGLLKDHALVLLVDLGEAQVLGVSDPGEGYAP